MTKCPYCAEEIQAEAVKCKHCSEWLKEQKHEASQICDDCRIEQPASEYVNGSPICQTCAERNIQTHNKVDNEYTPTFEIKETLKQGIHKSSGWSIGVFTFLLLALWTFIVAVVQISSRKASLDIAVDIAGMIGSFSLTIMFLLLGILCWIRNKRKCLNR